MFGKKRRSPHYRIIARDASGAVLLEVPADRLDPPEAAVVALSIEFFNDPQPCEIHRGAVRWRVQQQLAERCPKGADVPLAQLDEALRQVFPEGTRTVRLEETP